MKKKIFVLLGAVVLLVGLISGCVEDTGEEEASNNAPVADFNYSVTDKTITTMDMSTDVDNDTLSYMWDFGDNIGNSTEKNPTYVYLTNGYYTVTLTVDDGNDTATDSEDITIGTEPTADITAPVGNITVNTSAQFMDNSTKGDSNITTWSWTFGDDGTSAIQNPTHNYTSPGTYTVELTVTDADGLKDTSTVEVTVVEETS